MDLNYNEFFVKMKEAYSYMEDEHSKRLFDARVYYNNTGDVSRLIENASERTKEVLEITKRDIPKCSTQYTTDVYIPENEPLIIYGADENGKMMFENASKKTSEILFCDLDSDNIKEFCGVRVISLEEMITQYATCNIAISNQVYHKGLFDIARNMNLNILRSEKTIVLCGAYKVSDMYAEFFSTLNYNVVICGEIIGADIYNGVKVISREELLKKHKDDLVIILAKVAHKEHCIQQYEILTQYGFKNIVLKIGHIYDSNEQYFDEVIQFVEEEIFVDVGVMDGNTSVLFAKKCNNKYKKIYLFEPNKDCYKAIEENIGHLENTEIIKLGLWNEKDVLKFHSDGGVGSSCIDADGEIEINVDKLDNLLQGEPVTFIKMDIEGAELNALKGAAETIKKYKPKLAISIYHKDEDIIELPLYIKSLVPEYKLYLRHYTDMWIETVLYAVL